MNVRFSLPLIAGALWVGCSAARSPLECDAEAVRCVGDELHTCAPDGRSWVVEECARCVVEPEGPSCVQQLCVPDQSRCAGDGVTVQRCDADGLAYTETEVCDPGAGMLCSQGACRAACEFELEDANSLGCTFYPANLLNQTTDAMFGIVASNPNRWDVTVTVSTSDGPLESRVVGPGELTSFYLPGDENMIPGTGRDLTAFKLESTLPIAAYQFSPLDAANQRSNDASLLLPANTLGTEHFVVSYEVYGQVLIPEGFVGSPTYFAVVATEPDTEVTIFPSVDTIPGPGVPALSAGEPYTTRLAELEVVQVMNYLHRADMTGTRIASDKPIAVYGGHACANVPPGRSYCDHLHHQLFPVHTWGTKYVAANFMPRGQIPESDSWRIMAAHDDTVVTLSGPDTLPEVPPLASGESFLVDSDRPFLVTANRPILVAHLLHSQAVVQKPLAAIYTDPFQTEEGCATTTEAFTNMGDPALSFVVPDEQFRREYAFLTPETYAYSFVTVTARSTIEPLLELDGEAIHPEWTSITDDASFARLRVTPGPHALRSEIPFGIEVHGYDCNVSYAYPGGMNLAPLIK